MSMDEAPHPTTNQGPVQGQVVTNYGTVNIQMNTARPGTTTPTLDDRLEETLLLYLSKSFNEDKVAKLDQAGETDSDRSTLLRQVFIDLDVKPREGPSPHLLKYNQLKILDEIEEVSEIPVSDQGKILSAMHCFLQEPWSKFVLIGGPGQGKSTLGQYLAQV